MSGSMGNLTSPSKIDIKEKKAVLDLECLWRVISLSWQYATFTFLGILNVCLKGARDALVFKR